MNAQTLKLAKKIWDYHLVNNKIEKSDIIFVLGSHDIKVAYRAIELFKQWYADKILFSGWLWRLTSNDENFKNTTEADKFWQIAIEKWISFKDIIIENKSKNTWENIKYSYELIKNMDINKIIIVNKPYMERRTFATFLKQWPWKDILFYITSPQISFEKYTNNEEYLKNIINIMVWDLQRIIEYPKKWFQIYQKIPKDILDSYNELIKLWFIKNLI